MYHHSHPCLQSRVETGVDGPGPTRVEGSTLDHCNTPTLIYPRRRRSDPKSPYSTVTSCSPNLRSSYKHLNLT